MSLIKDLDDFISEYLEEIRKKDPFHIQCAFLLGNCFLRKSDYASALKYYQMSIKSSFKKPQYWRGSNQPHWLVDTLILSKKLELANEVDRELVSFSKQPDIAGYPIVWYAFAILSHLRMRGDTDSWVQKMLDKPKVKYTYLLGKALKAIRVRDEIEFNQSLSDFIKIHEGQAKFGSLRETPEGLICMPAMSVIYFALQSGISITVQSKYIVPEYFQT